MAARPRHSPTGLRASMCAVSFLLLALSFKSSDAFKKGPHYEGFIRASGTKLVDDTCKEFILNGWNSWGFMEAAAGEDYALPLGWNQSGRAFVQERMQTAVDTGFTALRVFAHGIEEDFPVMYRRGSYNEAALIGMDIIIQEAGLHGLKLIIPLANNWDIGFGVFVDSKANFAEWGARALGIPTPSNPDQLFYTDRVVKDMYKAHIDYLLNRVNSQTGVKWRDDQAILAWNIMNEPRCDAAQRPSCFDDMHQWLSEMSSFIKSKDPNHLVGSGAEGFYHMSSGRHHLNPGWNGTASWAEMTGQDFIRNNAIDTIDFCTVHMWPDDWGVPEGEMSFLTDWLSGHMADATELGKPCILEEFGKKKEPSQPASLRDPYYGLVYSKAVNAVPKGDNLKGLLFWEWQSTTEDLQKSSVERPYGVKETDTTWEKHIGPKSMELSSILSNNLAQNPVAGCSSKRD